MSLFRTSWLRRRDGGDSPVDAAQALRVEMADLEQQLAVAERTLGDLLSSARSAEQSAMDAIRCGNDQAAREALVEQRTQAERAAAVESDIGVLRGIVDECRDFLAKLPESAAVKL